MEFPRQGARSGFGQPPCFSAWLLFSAQAEHREEIRRCPPMLGREGIVQLGMTSADG